MRKLSVFFILLFLYPLIGFTQDIQYYRTIADTTHNKLLKLEAIDSVLSISFGRDNDTFIVFSIQYINLAQDIDSIELAAKKAMNLESILTVYKNDPRKAVTIIDRVLAYKYKIKDSFLLGGLYLKRGEANYRINLVKATKDYTSAINNFSKKDSIYLAYAYLFRGQAYSNLGKFIPAGLDFKHAYTYFEKLKNYEYMQYAHQGNITMYSKVGFYDKAKQERDNLIKKLIELDLTEPLAVSYFNQSVDYFKIGDKKLQLEYLLKAERILINNKSLHNSRIYILINCKMVEYYCRDYDFEKADKYLKIIDDKYERIKGDLIAKSYYYGAKAVYYEIVEEFDKALEFAKQKVEISHIINYGEDKMESHLLLSNIYYNLGEYQKSIDNKNEYYKIKDSIYNMSSVNSLAYYQTLYETEKNEKELVEKNANIQLLEKDNETFKKLSGIVGIAAILLFGLVLLYRNQRDLKNKKDLQEKYSQELLQSQEDERKRISNDLHDGLGQKLMIIKNKLISSGNNSAKVIVEEAIEEVRAISRDLHPLLLKELGLTKAIEHTINQMDENTSLFISSKIENIDNLFLKEQEINIYRIVQESLTNIIKHAEAEAGRVSVKKGAHDITISIKDNGIGFDFPNKYKDKKSLGLKTLVERTKFLNGQIKVQSGKGQGTLIEYIFPLT